MGTFTGNIAAYVFHRLPNFKGRWRILKALNQVHRFGLKNPVVEARLKSGLKMKVDLRARTEYESFYTGEYDHKVITSVLNLFKPSWQVLDVGGNIGFYAVPFAHRFAALRSGRVHCFEPVASNFRRLQENLKLNDVDPFATIYGFGLSNQEGTVLITLREDFEAGGETGNAAIVIEDGADSRFKTVSIQLKTLDQFVSESELERIDYIKADIEGHEDMLFEGGRETIRKFRPLIQAELNPDYFRRKGTDVEAVLMSFRSRDYEVVRFEPSKKFIRAKGTEHRQLHEDLFLIPREKLDWIVG